MLPPLTAHPHDADEGHRRRGAIVIGVNEGLDDKGSSPGIVGDQESPVLFEERENVRKSVDLELLVLRRLGIIMDPLRDGYEFTDKLQQKCDLFGLMLNNVKKIEHNVHEQLILSCMRFCGKNIVPEKGVIALFFVEKA